MTKNASSGSGDSKRILYCSFCSKSQHEVKKIIEGPTVCICDECLVLCMGVYITDGLIEDFFRDVFSIPDSTRSVLERAEYPSVGTLLRKGGLQKTRGPYNLYEVLFAVTSVLGIELRSPRPRLNEV